MRRNAPAINRVVRASDDSLPGARFFLPMPLRPSRRRRVTRTSDGPRSRSGGGKCSGGTGSRAERRSMSLLWTINPRPCCDGISRTKRAKEEAAGEQGPVSPSLLSTDKEDLSASESQCHAVHLLFELGPGQQAENCSDCCYRMTKDTGESRLSNPTRSCSFSLTFVTPLPSFPTFLMHVHTWCERCLTLHSSDGGPGTG